MISNIKERIKLLKEGKISEREFLSFIEHFPYKDLGDVKLDFHRKLRRGLPEVIYGSGKSIDHLKKIIEKFKELDENIIITRIDEERGKILTDNYSFLLYHEKARIITLKKEVKPDLEGKILVLTAGASDESVAEEAFVSAKYLGNNVEKGYDVGVACINRILDMKEKLNDYSVLIVIAGMEGALPSVVAGLTSTPVIAVPTSVGYGANLKGIAALLSMLNSCAGGLSVVNIDNGFGAAFQATLINRKINAARASSEPEKKNN